MAWDDHDDEVIWIMSAEQVRAARTRLGYMWGMNRAATPYELARALGLGGGDPGLMVVKWEAGKSRPSGPVSRLLQALLDGFRRQHGGEDAPEVAVRLPARVNGG
jgi:DNA-binding transcriptional regulator YiaG